MRNYVHLMAIFFVSCGFAFGQSFKFKIIEGRFTWEEAEIDARIRGGRLAVLNTQEKIDAARDYLDGLPSQRIGQAWIGFTNRSGSYRWVTGEEGGVTNWHPGTPNTSGITAAKLMRWSSGSVFGWDDDDVTFQRNYLLETSFADSDQDGVSDTIEILDRTNPDDSSDFRDFSTGLLGYYTLNGTVIDATGSGFDGVLVNAGFNTSEKGMQTFDNSSSGLTISQGGQRARSTSGWAISAWVKITDGSIIKNVNDWFTLYETGGNPDISESSVRIGYGTQGLTVNVDGDYNARFTTTLQDNIWYHLCYVIDGEILKAYLDGVEITDTEIGGNRDNLLSFRISNDDAAIGAWGNHSIGGYIKPNNSIIRNVRIYDRAISNLEISHIREFSYGLTDGLVSKYSFNEGNADDEITNENKGNITGATTTLDRFGNADSAYSFTGADTFIELSDPSLTRGLENHTSSFWINTSYEIQESERGRILVTPSFAILIQNRPGPNVTGYGKRLYLFSHDDRAGNTVEPWSSEYFFDIPIEEKWHHIVILLDQTGETFLYLDGTKYSPKEISRDRPGGEYNYAEIGRFNGALDDIRIYNRVLSEGEITSLYALESKGQGPFQIVEGNFTWKEAKADAEAKGGRLAVLDTQAKIDAADNYLQAYYSEDTFRVHIGLTDELVEGEYRWITGELLTASKWAGQEFLPTPGEDYVSWYRTSSSQYGWFDHTNSAKEQYLLEIIPRTPAAPILPVVEPFYESNPGETIVIDATPTKGYPTNFIYQWTFNGFPVPAFLGGADATLSLNGTSDQNGTWRVQVTNSEGSAEASFEYRVFVDNDSDTLSNYREENITLTNPNLADSDSDGLSDPEEIAAETDPNIADTDEDGVSDGAEVNTYATNPKKKDTDDDGLSDGDEINTYLSNPNNSDSDSDGISDASEVAAGLDLNTADTIASAVAFLTEELANRPDGFDEAMALARSAGQNDVTSNPSTYGLYGESAYNAIVLERDARFLDSDEDGITDEKEAELETDASSETVFYLQEELDSATANARAAGRSDVTTNPLDYALTTKAAYDGVVTERDARPTQAESDAAVSQARVAGRSDVMIDPASYSLFSAEAYTAVVAERDARPTLTAYNTAIVESLATGRSSVTNNPGDYGLYQAAEYNAVVAERDARPTQEAYTAVVAERDTRFLDSDEDGITDEKEAELETDTSKETVFYLQGALDTATADARSSGRSDVTTNPLDYALITKAAYDIVVAERDERPTVLACDTAVVEALSAGRLSVTSNPSEYGLYDSVAYNTVVAERDLRPTINAYNTAVADALTAGRLSVTTNPSGYGLYNAASYNAIIAERDARPSQAALDAVIAERDARPTPDQIKDARLGSVVLVPNIIEENEQIVQIRFRIEESNDLGIWESRQEVAEVNIPIKPGKKFYRFSVKED